MKKRNKMPRNDQTPYPFGRAQGLLSGVWNLYLKDTIASGRYQATVDKSKKRLALSGVCRFDSKSNDLLQIVDLIIGAVTYDIKYQNKLVSGDEFKLRLVDYIKNKLGTDTFAKGFRNHSFNIFVEQDNGIKEIEKGLSS